jgi:hypothetical protein
MKTVVFNTNKKLMGKIFDQKIERIKKVKRVWTKKAKKFYDGLKK